MVFNGKWYKGYGIENDSIIFAASGNVFAGLKSVNV